LHNGISVVPPYSENSASLFGLPVLELGPARQALTSTVVRGSHSLSECALFSDEELSRILDARPSGLQVFSLRDEKSPSGEWERTGVGSAGGDEIFGAVQRGKLFCNVLSLQRDDERFAAIGKAVEAELAALLPDLIHGSSSVTLLISSPKMKTFYHVDPGPNLLLPGRGEKTLWIYPALDRRFAATTDIEDIFARTRFECLPFDPSFDDAALVMTLEPGEVVGWPLNSPHRVVNGESVCVSLALEFVTERSRRREEAWVAHRFVRRQLHIPCGPPRESGLGTALQTSLYRSARKLRIAKSAPGFDLPVHRQLDANAPSGYRDLTDDSARRQ
jgi:hypothetical protein